MNDKNNNKKAACGADPDNPETSSDMGTECGNYQSKYLNDGNVSQQYSRITLTASHNVWGIFYGIIYKITDINKDKTLNRIRVYIGQTIQELKERFRQHFKSPPNKLLAEAFDRYNKEFIIVENGNVNGTMSYRTKGGEFFIELIRYCPDVDSINEAEIEEIESHKSFIFKYGTDYGYNLTRGGGASPIPKIGQRGKKHWRWINIDERLLIELIKKGFLIREIAGEFGVSMPTIERRIRQLKDNYGVKNITEARKHFGGSEEASKRRSYVNSMAHPNKKEILDENFIEQINLLKTRKEIQKALSIGHVQFYDKLEEMGYEDLEDARRELGVLEDYKKQYAERIRDLRFKEIDTEEFKNQIRYGLTLVELKKEFEIGEIQFYYKLAEIGYDSVPKARKDLGGERNFKIRNYFKTSKKLFKSLAYLHENHKIFTTSYLAKMIKTTEGGAQYHLNKLKTLGLITVISFRQKGNWECILTKLCISFLKKFNILI